MDLLLYILAAFVGWLGGTISGIGIAQTYHRWRQRKAQQAIIQGLMHGMLAQQQMQQEETDWQDLFEDVQ